MVGRGQSETGLVEVPEGRNGVSRWWLAPFLLVIAAAPFVWKPLGRLAGPLSATETGRAEPARIPSRLGFSASHEGSDWRLVWNRDALARLRAVGAMLTIHDGGADRLQFLSTQDLAAGTIFYIPRTTDLTFNLKVALADGPDIEEQIRVIGATPDSVPQLAESIPPRRIGGATRDETDDSAGGGAKPALRDFQPPEPPAPAPAPVADPALPQAKLPAAPVTALPGSLAPAPPRPIPAAPQAPAPSPRELAPPPRPAPAPITRIEPAVLRTVPAAWPRNVARNTELDVRILVRIDERGRVVSASPVQRTVTNFPYVDTAMTAARLWTFSPALENGKPVPSETVLTFKFRP